jgi:hypothetical protein
MKWIKINANKLPNGEVLAINDKNDILAGWLIKGLNNDIICDGGIILENCTHYLDFAELLKLEKQ